MNKDSVTEKILDTASDGKNYLIQFYFLDVIFASPTDINVGDVSEIKLTVRQKKIIGLIKDNPTITAKQMSETLSVSQRTVERDLSILKEKDVLKREGKDNAGTWTLHVHVGS